MKKRGKSKFKWIDEGLLELLVVVAVIVFLFYLDLRPEITGLTIFIGSEPPEVTVNFSDELGTIREDFYGVNDESLVLSNSTYSYLDSDCDGVKDTPVDLSLNRELFANSNMSYVRFWAWLHYISIEENIYNETIIRWLMDEAEYAHSQGYRILLRTDVMPYWLQDRNCSYCTEADWNSCPPSNNSKFGIVIDHIVNNLTQVIPEEDIDVEILNEPWDDAWLNNGTDTERVLIYADMFNTTRKVIKENHPNVSVGWTGTYDLSEIYFYRTEGLISNLTNNTDFVYLHTYPYDYLTTNTLYDNLKNLSDTFDIYGVSPKPKTGFSEWNVWSGTYMYDSDRYSAEIAFAYQSVLNYKPDVSLLFFEFSKFQSYDDCPSLYPEYPLKFPMFNELDNYIAPTYNVTKNFGSYHSPGSVVVNSTSIDSIKVVASKKDRQYITIVNTEDETNISLGVANNISSSFKDLTTGEIYTLDNGIIELSLLGYEIRYLESYEEPSEPPEPPTPPSEDGGGGGGSGKGKSNKTHPQNKSNENNDNKGKGKTKEQTPKPKDAEIEYDTTEPLSGKVAGTGSAILEGKAEIWKIFVIFIVMVIIGSIIVLYIIYKKTK